LLNDTFYIKPATETNQFSGVHYLKGAEGEIEKKVILPPKSKNRYASKKE